MQRIACAVALALLCTASGSGCATLLVSHGIDRPSRQWLHPFDGVSHVFLRQDPGGGLIVEVRARFDDRERPVVRSAALRHLAWPARPEDIALFVKTDAPREVRIGAPVYPVGADGSVAATPVTLTRDRARSAAIVQVVGDYRRVGIYVYIPPAGERAGRQLEGELLAHFPPAAIIDIESPVRAQAYVVAPVAVAGALAIDAATLPLQLIALMVLGIVVLT